MLRVKPTGCNRPPCMRLSGVHGKSLEQRMPVNEALY